MSRFSSLMSVFSLLLLMGITVHSQGLGLNYYVSVTGNDNNDGLTPNTPFRTVAQAWNQIPMGEELAQAYTINIGPGTYTPEDLPNYWESRYGTEEHSINIGGTSEAKDIILSSINMYDVRHLNLFSVTISTESGLPFHCEKCDYIRLGANIIRGAAPGGDVHETVKFNQSQHITLFQNDISGADDNAIDFVAVQYAKVSNNKIHDAGDWCMYTKGGSAYITVEANEIYDCGTGGFTAGQGTGFQFMTPPWLQYEAYAIWFRGNRVHDTFGAGVGVNGGYDIAITGNIFYKVGERSHAIEIVYGLRTCDGQPGDEGRERCAEYREMGGWGNDLVDDGTNAVLIPNKNIIVHLNVVYNPTPFQSADQHFTIAGPYEGPLQNNSNLGPVVADENLIMTVNQIWNGDETMPLGIEPDFEAGCQDINPTCNAEQLRADNLINVSKPELVDPENDNLELGRPDPLISALLQAKNFSSFPAWDVPIPEPDPAWFAYSIIKKQ